MNKQELVIALRNNDYYKNLSNKDFFDDDNINNLVKYLKNTFAKTDESEKVILDMLSGKTYNPNDLYNYRITQEELFKLNKKYYDNTYLYHGLNAYTTNLTDKSLDVGEKIENNLYNIANNKEIELATSSTHMIGDIGVKGKGNSLFAQPWDMYSVVDKETGERSKPKSKSIITEDDVYGIIEKYENNPKDIKSWGKHDEVIAKNFEIESLWVKENFYNNNQDLVLKLLKDNEIQNLDIVHSNSFEQHYYDVNIERVSIEKLGKSSTHTTVDNYSPKYYTESQLDAIFNFKHKRTMQPTSETKFKDIYYDEAGEHFDFTNFDEFQKIGGNKSFAKFNSSIIEEHRDIIKKYWNLLNQVDGNVFIANQEAEKIFSELENQIINEYSENIHKAFTEHATNGEYNNINRYMKENLDVHNQMVNHYLDTGKIPNATTSKDSTLVLNEPKDVVPIVKTPEVSSKIESANPSNITRSKKYKPTKGPKLKQKTAEQTIKNTKSNKVSNITQTKINKPKSTSVAKKLTPKKISGGGALAIGLTIAGAVVGISALRENKPNDEKRKNNTFNATTSYNYNYIDNSQAMQMAQDVSSYRYGKHMTGFVNF